MTSRKHTSVRLLLVACLAALPSATALGQTRDCHTQDTLLTIPVIKSADHKLRATLKLVDGVRNMWGFTGDTRCLPQTMRQLQGFQGFDASTQPAWPTGTEPIPGPTFRARLGDLVQIAFFNQLDVSKFQTSLDKGIADSVAACDQVTTQQSDVTSGLSPSAPDGMPNCIHGSTTTNVHFHGTHTTPSTTGDNVLLFIRPALRDRDNKLRPADEQAALSAFQRVFDTCAANGPPTSWTDLPIDWQNKQRDLVKEYDATAPWRGTPGALPASSRLWPSDSAALAKGLWPQYQVGANPYCFPLPKFDSTQMRMGQAPGTHWYHAHKHGSTALNVANGLTGAFIIAGEYDDTLHAYYGPDFREQVLMLQQLATVPFPNVPVKGLAPVSVNGRLNPIVKMRRGEVQMWRIINGVFRDAMEIRYFEPKSATSCKPLNAPSTSSRLRWRQIAQDGVQFNVKSYADAVGSENAPLNLAPANRADFLVKAPTDSGIYTLCVAHNMGVDIQKGFGAPDAPTALLTVEVGGTPVSPAQQFIPNGRFPVQPAFLADIRDDEIKHRRELTFGPVFNKIDGKVFEDHHLNQAMMLNTAEEWTIKNAANSVAHPFHIHINPFQIFAIFEPNAPEAQDSTLKDRDGKIIVDRAGKPVRNPCWVNSSDTTTFKPCAKTQPHTPHVWWDTFAIPTGRQDTVTAKCTAKGATEAVFANCPVDLKPYIACAPGKMKDGTTHNVCIEYIPGWIRTRSRFVDFAGQFVLHCHILVHEDRGMMQLIEVVSDKTPYSHH